VHPHDLLEGCRVIVSLLYPAVRKLLSVPVLLLRPDPAKDAELVAAG
jgi:hypothetical protein